MRRFFKWLWNAAFGQWHQCHCYHCDDKGNYCERIDCHPGSCVTRDGERF